MWPVYQPYRVHGGLCGTVRAPECYMDASAWAAIYLDKCGLYGKAANMHKQTWEQRKAVLGEEHPSTLTSMNNLAFTWKGQCKNTKAINLMSECVHLQTRILGLNHPDTLSSSAAFTEWQIQEPEGSSSATNNMTFIQRKRTRPDRASDRAIHSGPRKKGFFTTLRQKFR